MGTEDSKNRAIHSCCTEVCFGPAENCSSRSSLNGESPRFCAKFFGPLHSNARSGSYLLWPCTLEADGFWETMAGAGVECETERPLALKRRKICKGTLSCCGCKRRKIRCTFVAPTESTCNGCCRSRQVKCISQEFPNQVELSNSEVDRLYRVEAMAEQMAKKPGTNSPGLLSQGAQGARMKLFVNTSCCRFLRLRQL